MAMQPPGFGDPRRRRFRRIPVRMLAPNVITLLAMCAGLTAIRMAFENRYVLALAAIVFAAILDGIDGRLARFLKGTSRFGAELDSLVRLRQFRRRAGADPLFLGPARPEIGRLDRRHGVRDLRRAAARALQRHDRRSGPAGLGRQFLRRHAGAGRRHHGAAADLCGVPRRAALGDF